MKTVTVNLSDRSYPIHIGAGLLDHAELVGKHVHGKQVMIVSNETVAPLYMDKTKKLFTNFETHEVILPDGEVYKNLDELNKIFDVLLQNHFDRYTTLVALGGGVIGDMTGFAAACYQRGVPFIQIPTTLLAQVDSSVGGKTGVNHRLGKNMIGAFYQPQCVLADTETLDTLPDRELSAGLAEVIKYGLIRLPDFIDWLEANMAKCLARDREALAYAIEVSCQCKAEIVATDEKEGGIRAILNLGHTFGHAIESGMGYGNWLHGEAVAMGMVMAADVSMRQGWLKQADVDRVVKLVQSAKLPVKLPASMDFDTFMQYMQVDKKVRDGKINYVLLDSLGKAKITNQVDAEKIKACIESCRE